MLVLAAVAFPGFDGPGGGSMKRLLAAAFVCASVVSAAQAADCTLKLTRFTTLPLTFTTTGQVTVPLKLGGQTLRMMIGTGSYRSAVSWSVIQRLNLPVHGLSRRSGGAGFGARGETVDASYEIAGVPMPAGTFVVRSLSDEIDGILGADLLSGFDVDFDFANGRVSLFSQKHCEGKVVHWTKGDYSVVPFDWSDVRRDITVDVRVDDKRFPAVIESGAARSILTLEEAAGSFDIGRDVLDKQRHYPFKTLTLGGVSVASPDIYLAKRGQYELRPNNPDAEMVVGITILRQLHLYIAYGEHKLYATDYAAGSTPPPAGYLAFVHGVTAQADGEFARATAFYGKALDDGGLVPSYMLRAHIGRGESFRRSHDCVAAKTEAEAALAMAPNDGRAIEQRALTNECLGQLDAARADFDALVASNGSVWNLFARGRFHWRRGAFAESAADLMRAHELYPVALDLMMWSAIASVRSGTFDKARFDEYYKVAKSQGQQTIQYEMILGIKTPQDFIKWSQNEFANFPPEKQCDADFFAGEWMLAGKDSGGKVLLQKAQKECPVDGMIGEAVTADLSRLP